MIKYHHQNNLKFETMRNFFLVLLVFCASAVGGQSSPSQITRNSTYRLTSDTGRGYDIRERLVQLAMQNPQYEMVDHAANAAEYQIRLAKGNWLNIFSASGNVNEFTVNQLTGTGNAATQNIYYPKYNLGLT